MDKSPWSDEPTPLCDKMQENPALKAGFNDWPAFAEDLERRLRHAWKLVNSLRIDAMNARDMGETAEYALEFDEIESRLSDIEETLQ